MLMDLAQRAKRAYTSMVQVLKKPSATNLPEDTVKIVRLRTAREMGVKVDERELPEVPRPATQIFKWGRNQVHLMQFFTDGSLRHYRPKARGKSVRRLWKAERRHQRLMLRQVGEAQQRRALQLQHAAVEALRASAQ